MIDKKRVLFICVHNSARSQIAEAYLNSLGVDRFEAESAGLEPGNLNPFVVESLKDDGIDISGNKTSSVDEKINSGVNYDYVITVCSEAESEHCPVFPGKVKRLHWSFPDPSKLHGTDEEKLNAIREIRNSIKQEVLKFINNSN